MFCSKEQNYCAHGRTGKKTCYNKYELLLIAEEIENIEGRKLNFKRNEDMIELLKDISSYMKTKHNCEDELCWVETLKLKKIENLAFKPKLPKEWLSCNTSMVPNNNCMNTWLSNLEIDEVLGQLEINVPSFDYLGSVPIDFAKLEDKKINKFTVKDAISNNKTKIGVVFNTDPSYKGGQHWICAFIDLESNEINFFDSYGSNGYYPKELDVFFNKLIEEGKSIGLDIKIKKNIVRHQFKNSECGVYCLKFITERLNSTFEEIVNKSMPDDSLTVDRWDKFFRTETCRPKQRF
jgi:hypothetical protein